MQDNGYLRHPKRNSWNISFSLHSSAYKDYSKVDKFIVLYTIDLEKRKVYVSRMVYGRKNIWSKII